MEKRRQWRGGVCKTVLRLSVAFIRATKSSKIALIARRQAKKSLKSVEKEEGEEDGVGSPPGNLISALAKSLCCTSESLEQQNET